MGLVGALGDASMAAACVVAAEVGASAVLLGMARSDQVRIRPRFRRRAWSILARRGAVAGASRFARVGLYAADLLILGALTSSLALGPYAAGRRVAFALLSLGLVVPLGGSPRGSLGRGPRGGDQARRLIARTLSGLLMITLPATVGLVATADRWMPLLFGDGFGQGGRWLALIVARLPFVLTSNVQQVALIACRREGLALRLVLGQAGLALVTLVPLAWLGGAWGVGLGVLAIEVAAAVAGWLALRSLGVAPAWHHHVGPALAGCLTMLGVCLIGRSWPLAVVVVAAAATYGGSVLILTRNGRATS